jgi:hypothetical protein
VWLITFWGQYAGIGSGGSTGDGIMCYIQFGVVCGQLCVIWVFGDPVLAGQGSWGRVGCSESVLRAGRHCHFWADLTAAAPDHRVRHQAPACMFTPLHSLSLATVEPQHPFGACVCPWYTCIWFGGDTQTFPANPSAEGPTYQ